MFTATITLDADDFALPVALRRAPETTVEAERLAAHSRHWVMPCLWAAGDDIVTFEDALADDPTVQRVVTAVQVGGETYYEIEWADRLKRLVDEWLDMEASILHAETSGTDWLLRIRFATREQFEAFRDSLSADGLSFRLEELSQASAPRQQAVGLTTAQHEALVTAVEHGYFAVPRQATMETVADSLGISIQAASERIRRGIDQFVRSSLVVAPEADVADTT